MTVLTTINSKSTPNPKTRSQTRRPTTLRYGEIVNEVKPTNNPMSHSSECRSPPANSLLDTDNNERKTNSNQAAVAGFSPFRFNIDNDENLQNIINNDLTGELAIFNNMNETDILTDSSNELTSDYILSKLYNYMKISEMSKYGISVFEMTFSSYLQYLNESDLRKLAVSYWCNGKHFNCIVSHRGDLIKAQSTDRNVDDAKCELKLEISLDLLDAAMQSGASVEKIEAMLLQKRIDNGIKTKINKNQMYAHTKYEGNFYLRNLKHRFWNYEVLVRVFVQNGWLTPNLADVAMKTFIKAIYHRVLQSKSAIVDNRRKRDGRNCGDIKFSENFLHSFFVTYFCLDDIPKMYKKEISQLKINNSNNNNDCVNQISEELLRRWCELIELLASRGANVNEYEFRKIMPLQYALNIGKNTYKIISSSHKKKNMQLIPESYNQQNIHIPDDVWNILVSYL